MTNEYEEQARARKAAMIAEALIEAVGTIDSAIEAAQIIIDHGEYDHLRGTIAEAIGVNKPSVRTMRVVVGILQAKREGRGAAKFAKDLAKGFPMRPSK